jgi:DNA-binding MarR family transcriptional regulator
MVQKIVAIRNYLDGGCLVKIVSNRYYFSVSKANDSDARTIAELVVQLGRITHGSGYGGGLTPAQWAALRYLARANRFSRTVSAFADFHATTRGTASQTVKSLISHGYLSRERSTRDGRSASLEVTDAAKELLAQDPYKDLVCAAGSLSATARSHLAIGLQRLLVQLTNTCGKRMFGVCASCEHLEEESSQKEGANHFVCTHFGELLEDAELDEICVNFRPAEKKAGS